MKKHRKQNRKPQQNPAPKFKAIPFVAEIDVLPEENFVKIPVSEFTGLVANNALLNAVKRVIADDPYDNYITLRTMLGVTKQKEAK